MTCSRFAASLLLRTLAGALTVSVTLLVCPAQASAAELVFSTEAERIAYQIAFCNNQFLCPSIETD